MEKEKGKDKAEAKRRLDWHSGFEGGLQLSFRKYRGELTIEREHPLSEEPLRIDFVVIKKNTDTIINNDIGRDFRKFNIIEYKDSDDGLNLDVLWKTIGYACLYKSLGNTTNEIKIEDITVSIFRTRKPKKLIYELTRNGKTVECVRPGIYAVNGIIAFPVNIVVIRELEDKELLALKIMERRADEEEVKLFLQETRKLTEQGDRRHADAVLQISAKINRELYKKLRGENMCEALREIMAEVL